MVRTRVEIADIELVASSVYSTRQWLVAFGRKYYQTRSLQRVEIWCKGGRLPQGWQPLPHGFRYYIFRTGDLAPLTPKLKITPQQIEELKRAAKRGLRFGEQRMYAEKFECSQSQISRILSGLRRAPQKHPAPAKPDLRRVPRVASSKVKQVFDVLLTVKEWVEHVGRPEYGINSLPYVYQMCSQRPNGRAKYPTRLPESWNAIRVGESWLIYHDSLKHRDVLMGKKSHTRR